MLVSVLLWSYANVLLLLLCYAVDGVPPVWYWPCIGDGGGVCDNDL
jgi:hypothetical protein